MAIKRSTAGASASLGSPTLSNLTISGNRASNGGGLYNAGGSSTLTNVTIADNYAGNQGGGLYNDNSTAQAQNSII